MNKRRISYFVLSLALILSLTLITQTDSFAKTRVQKVVYDVAGNDAYFDNSKAITIDKQAVEKDLPKPSPKIWKGKDIIKVESAIYPLILKLFRPIYFSNLSVD